MSDMQNESMESLNEQGDSSSVREEEEGEDLMNPSNKTPGSYSDNDDDDDEDDEDDEGELTEADKKFIVDDDEEEDNIIKVKSKKRKNKHAINEDDEQERQGGTSDLEDDDLDLINENIGLESRKMFKRLRKVADHKSSEPKDLTQLFEEEELKGEGGESREAGEAFDERELYEDDLDDFVITDDEEGGARARKERLKRKRERQETGNNRGASYGVSDEAWAEINELFGDGSDYAFAMYDDNEAEVLDDDSMESTIVKPKKEVTLKDFVEPAIIATRMLTDEDKIIRLADIPERFQVERKNLIEPDEEQLSREALFIAQQILPETTRNPDFSTLILENPFVKAIINVLKFIHYDKFEVPFIALHRKDYYVPHLPAASLWRIYDLDEKFLTVESKKKSLVSSYEDLCNVSSAARTNEYAKDLLDKVSSLEEISDLQMYFSLLYSLHLSSLETSRSRLVKKPLWRVSYEGAKRNQLDKFAQLFGINTRKYANSLVTRQPCHFPENVHMMPLEAAQDYVCTLYPTPEKVLSGTREMLAYEIAADPSLRLFIRRVYSTDSVLTVTPTSKGKVHIKPDHKYYPFKYLTNKPVSSFSNSGMFLEIMAAENEGLVTVTAKVDMEEQLLEDMILNIKSDYSSAVALAWDEQRVLIADYVAKEILFQQMLKWVKEKLTLDAIDYVTNACKVELEKKLDEAPYRPVRDERNYGDDTPPTVLALSWGEGDKTNPTHGAIIDPNGMLLHHFTLPKLGDRDHTNDVEKLEEKISIYDPDVIVMAGFHPSIKAYLFKLVGETIEKTDSNWKKKPEIFMIEDDIARIFMKSNRGIKEFPESHFPPLVRYLVSLGRKVQDPIVEYAGLVNPDDDIKRLELHPLQNLVPEDKFKRALERSFMNIIAICGVDINQCVFNPQFSGVLQFVSGLGPRKAGSFISKITRSGGKLISRADLVLNHICSEKIWINCASFIRIKERHFLRSRSNYNIDVLDDTRIHPEDYELARKMAADAMELDEIDEDNPSAHIIELMESKDDKLSYLLLEDYAEELYKSQHKLKKLALEDVRLELTDPFSEKRRKFEGASPDTVFTMLTSETDETLHIGSLVNVSIQRIKDRYMFCQHNSGMDAMIYVKNMDIPSTMLDRPQLEKLYTVNTTIPARVLNVQKDRMTLELDIRKGAILNRSYDIIKRDPSFSLDREEQDLMLVSSSSSSKRNQESHGAQGRVIQHPFFKNIDYHGAEQYLESRSRGDIVVRPSTKGNNHISITWKVDNNIYQHIDVLENKKENELALGKILKIDNREYLEIDQIIAEHIEPMTRKITEVVRHAKFQSNKDLSEMKRYIEQQAQYFKRSMYGFILCKEKPGTVYLVFKHPQNSVKNEIIIIQPEGFIFRTHKFRDVERLLRYFKEDEGRKAQSATPVAVSASTNRVASHGHSSSSSHGHSSSRGHLSSNGQSNGQSYQGHGHRRH